MTNPKCSKCEADSSKFLVWNHVSAEGNLVLLYCSDCGAVQGIVRKES